MALVEIASKGPITSVTLNRPEKRNALTVQMLRELAEAYREIARERSHRVVILRGEGLSFCTGLDLVETKNRDLARDSAKNMGEVLRVIVRTPAVTIAAVRGHAIAGGAGIMSACDIVVAEEGTKIGYPEPRRGLVAAMVMTLLQRQIGDRKTRELLLTGELIDAGEALRIGLVTKVVPRGGLEAEVDSYTTQILKNAPGALADTKILLEALTPRNFETALARSYAVALRMRGSTEAREGLGAYEEKRNPNWEV
ncbi:MAG TPA: enoyl-CoA hydratase-related protein [Opitutaceae bacterium]|nr:enoyl-CoA hydratase-related protein [Opitutaceae bacterium]